jgi:hypothetical protein
MKIVIWLPVEMRVTVKEREEEKIHLVLPCLLEPTDVLVRAGRTDESGEVVASAFGSRRRLSAPGQSRRRRRTGQWREDRVLL